jgi:hypothetical protein
VAALVSGSVVAVGGRSWAGSGAAGDQPGQCDRQQRDRRGARGARADRASSCAEIFEKGPVGISFRDWHTISGMSISDEQVSEALRVMSSDRA